MEESFGGAGMPDAWQRLWAPHRMEYLRGENRPLDTNEVPCPFCRIPTLSDEEGLVVARGKTAYVVMNLYPYNAGHLLVCAYRHVPDLTDLTDEERNEISSLTAHSMRTLRKVSNAAGFNIGMNQGEVSGAGVAAHIHQHVVPRWGGDANFMPIIAGVKVLPQLLSQTRADLAAAW
ncbi:MAG: HIT domain-containing protein [Candidatus Nanopelagicaceae bacterium]|nr:HIT domain-containing protein [Candidatus Nanopelagicaceae bacterium]